MASDVSLLRDSLLNYVVSPLHAFGLGGFVFDVESETTMNLTAEITDHFLEDNSTVNDHIAIKPKKVTLKGFVGELVYRGDDDIFDTVQRVAQKLTIATALLPKLADAAEQISNTARGVNNNEESALGINKIADFWALAKNISPEANAQARAYQYFKAMMEQKMLVSLQTPFEFISSMAIESVVARQDQGTLYMSDFTVTLKQIRTVDVLTIAASGDKFKVTEVNNEKKPQGRNKFQERALINIGIMNGTQASLDDDGFWSSYEIFK